MSEREIVSRAQMGDLQAFEQLYESHKGRIYAVSLRLVKDPSKAEDLTQEAFIQAWQKLSSFRGRSSFATWLHRVAVNLILGRIRSEKRWSDRETPIDEQAFHLGDPSEGIRDSAIDLDRAIGLLPNQARLVFLLHDVEGYRHADIATMMGIAEGTSKAHLHRARQLLRKVLER